MGPSVWDENGRGDWRVCGKDRRPNPHSICATPYHSAQPFAVAIVGGPWLKYRFHPPFTRRRSWLWGSRTRLTTQEWYYSIRSPDGQPYRPQS